MPSRLALLALVVALGTSGAASAQEAPRVPAPAVAEPARPTAVTTQAESAEADAPVDEATDRARHSGLAIGTGVGSDNVFLGGHLAYYVQLPHPKFRIAVHAGAGVTPLGDPAIGWGVRGGTFLAYGLRHRLIVAAYGGTLSWTNYGLHGVGIGVRQNFGAGLGLGWEWMHETGLYLRATVGPALSFTPDTGLREPRHELVWRGNFFAIGYKLW